MGEVMDAEPKLEPCPCPWCGNPPTVREDERDQNTPWWFVGCTKARSEECPAFCWTGAATRAEAIDRWNRRAKPALDAETQARLEVLRLNLHELLDETPKQRLTGPERNAIEAVLNGMTQRHHRDILRALLDEKGGAPGDCGTGTGTVCPPPKTKDTPHANEKGGAAIRPETPNMVRPSSHGAPPDSPANIAADLRGATFHSLRDSLITVRIRGVEREVGHWSVETAARVEALGLMSAETKAALEWAIPRLKHGASRAALAVEPYRTHLAALQALLDASDEKGGGKVQVAAATIQPGHAPDPPPDSLAKITADLREVGSNWQQSGYVTDGDRLQQFAARVEALGATHDAEVDQFNAGYEHAKSGGAYDPPSFYPNDQDTWGCGYAWWKWLNREALGLEPSEREVVRKVVAEVTYATNRLRDEDTFNHEWARLNDWAIAALAPIAEGKEGT